MEYFTRWEIKSICNDNFKNAFSIFSIFLMLIIFINLYIIPAHAGSTINKHNEMTGNLTDPECIGCHSDEPVTQAQTSIQIEKPLTKGIPSINTASINNYTAILKIGQTPHQLGFTFQSGSITGWQWWDVAGFGSDEQKNMVLLSILDNSTGTIKPVSGLASLPSWPQASYRNHSGTYSYKADTDLSPISTQNNYPDQTEILMVKAVNLTSLSSATLSFWTWYSMEIDWDYGYVTVSTDGYSWTNIAGTVTTNTDPNGNNLGNGITGNSGGIWVQETMDLTPYAGKNIWLGFRFKSDAATNEEGWYVDDITVSGGVFGDDAETSLEIKILSVNVTYPKLAISGATDPLTPSAILQYDQRVQQVKLDEYLDHPGTYFGYFIYDPFAQQYPGNYIVNLDTAIEDTQVSATSQFQTTNYGCQGCHNKKMGSDAETSYVHGEGGGMQSCAFVCHAGSRGLYGDGYMGPPIPANPMHVHEMIYGHQGGYLDGAYYTQPPYNVQAHVNLSCQQCHTSFIHDNTGSDISSVWNYLLYGTNITYSSGTHESLTCQNCHGDLTYPDIPQNQYVLTGRLGSYAPTFTSSRSFTDTFVIDADGTQNITLSVTGDADKRIALYVIGPVDNTSTGLQGPCSYGNPCYLAQNLPINLEIPSPYKGKWLANLIMLQPGAADYTITSNSPLENKPIINIPDCNNCHNTTASGGANTKYEIPDWNPGFSHTDTNKDGTLDIQCRMCHDAMHNITIKACQTCHTRAPISHPIPDPSFSQYSQSQCLACHGDPHKVTAAGGGCVGCHSSPGTRYYVNTSLFAGHASLNTSDGANNVTDADCMTCHFRSSDIIMSPDVGLGAANSSNTYFCEDCHTTGGLGPIKPTNPVLMKNGLSHGSTNCQWCHIAGDPLPRPLDSPLRFHPNGPKGTASGKNCLSCHYFANLPDLPFLAPGEKHRNDIAKCDDCHSQADNHGVTPLISDPPTPPLISDLSVTTPVIAGDVVHVQNRVTDQWMQIAAAQYQLKKGTTIVKDWTNMTPIDGRFDSLSEVVIADIDTSSLLGTYTVYVKGMASAPKTGGGPYYPFNGQWSGVYTTQFIVNEPEGFDNGTVYGSSGDKLAGAIVSTDTGISTVTNGTGFYSLSLANGTYHLTASKEPEYYPNSSVVVTVMAFTTVTQDITLTAKPTGTITGKVTN